MKKLLPILILCLVFSACSKVNREADNEYGKGHNGILWGESKAESANWIQGSLGAPVKVLKQANPEVAREAKDNRKKYLKKLHIVTVPDLDDDVAVVYLFTGLQYVMSFDKRDRFCAVTFGPPAPLAPLTVNKKRADTQKLFEAEVLKPLIQKFGKPQRYQYNRKQMESRYWVWRGKRVTYVLEFMFQKGKKDAPSFWQYSNSIILTRSKYFETNK